MSALDKFTEFADAPVWVVALARDLAELHREVRKLTQPVNLLTIRQAAERLGKTPRAMDDLARRIFSDTREPWDRRPGVRRLVYGDELEVYIHERASGLRRFRRDCGRLTC